MATKSIIVGVDDSAGAGDALRWALTEADLHDAQVTAVLAWGFLDQHQAIPAERFDPTYGADEAAGALRSHLTAAIGAERAARVLATAVCDLPARALLDASRQADLLVVGARGLGGFEGLLLGSVSQHCLHHSAVPIAVVRVGPTREGRPPRVVVGVDGSDNAQHALRWALEEARCRTAQLDVVTAWQLPPTGGVPSAAAVDPIVYDRAALRVAANAVATEADADLCLLYTSPSPRDISGSRMPSSA